jgi:selenocysteine lyase/cysteine desulfurase
MAERENLQMESTPGRSSSTRQGEAGLACQKDRFSLPAGCHYLNSAYMSPLSKRVQEAGIAGVLRKAVPGEIHSEDFFTGCDEVRRLFSELVNGGTPERIAIIPAASYGLATVARNTPVAAGQNVVTIHHQFPSNVHTWQRLCDTSGASMRAVKAPSDGADRTQLWNEAVLNAIDHDTAVVALSPFHWTDGTRFDLEHIGERAREVGAALVVDGTQAIGAEVFDVQRIQPDAVVCAAYKWLTGPYSIGVAYLGRRYDDGVPLEETWLAREGSHDFSKLAEQGSTYRAGAARYDVGETPNFVAVPMLIAALQQLLDWGVANIASYIGTLTESLFLDERLRTLGLSDGQPETPHLFGLTLPAEVDPGKVNDQLRECDVFVSVRGKVVRVSPHVFNDRGDTEALIKALAGAIS